MGIRRPVYWALMPVCFGQRALLAASVGLSHQRDLADAAAAAAAAAAVCYEYVYMYVCI